jgi:hypothetical protein
VVTPLIVCLQACARVIEQTTMDDAKRRRLDPVRISCHSLPEKLLPSILSHLDVKTLIQKKRVCSTWWHDTCKEAVDAKQTSTTSKAFLTTQELCEAVQKYCGYIAHEEDDSKKDDSKDSVLLKTLKSLHKHMDIP